MPNFHACVMAICSQGHKNGSKQTMLLDSVDICPTILRGCGLNQFMKV